MDYLHSETFASRVKDLMQKYHVPGVSVAVVSKNEETSRSFGHASVEPGVSCTPETLFDIASASKSLTAAAVALLVEDDTYPHVKWDTPVAKILPEDFVLSDERYTNEVTVEDILSHRSGFPSHDDSYKSERATHPGDARSVTRNLRNLPMAAPPRTKYMYCNIMFTVASYLVEQVSGMAFPDYLEEKIFKPLGMTSTNLQASQARLKGLGNRIADGHYWDDEAGEYRQHQAYDCKEGQGAGAIITSAEDYLKWVKALMNQEGPITAEVYNGLVKMRIIPDPDPHAEGIAPGCSPVAYCAGLEVFWYRGHLVVSHDGSIPIFGSTHFFLPSIKFGGVVLGNGSDGWNVAVALLRDLVDEALEMPVSERPKWPEHKDRSDEDEDGDKKDELDKVRKKLCVNDQEAEPLITPLSWYEGTYTHPGYGEMVVSSRNGEPFIDASDRTDGGNLHRFEHVCQQTKFISHISSLLCGGDEPVVAEFELGPTGAVRMGIHLEADVEELIWFTKTTAESREEQSLLPLR